MAGTSLKHPRDYKLPYSLNWKKNKKTKMEFILCFYNCVFKIEIGNSIKQIQRI